MTVDIRQIVESPIEQGKDEIVIYRLTTTPYGSSPTTVSVTIYDVTDAYTLLVLTTIMPVNTPTVLGDVISLSPLMLLTPGMLYRVEIKFTAGGNVWEPWFIVVAKN